MAYSVKEGEEIHRNLSQDIVSNLLQPYYLTGCFFMILNLTTLLLEQNLTLLSTIKSHLRKMPKVITQRTKLYTSKSGVHNLFTTADRKTSYKCTNGRH